MRSPIGPYADVRPMSGIRADDPESISEQDGDDAHGWTPLKPTSRGRRRPAAGPSGRGRRARRRRSRYAELLRGADRVATRLSRWGTGRGDRVGLWLPKGLEAVTAIHGILRAGAAYVPADPTGPPARAAAILAAAGVKAAIVAAELAPALRAAWPGGGPLPRLILVGDEPYGRRPTPGPIAAGDAPLGRGHGRRRALSPAPPPRRGRPGLHPLHLRARPASPRA